jgi:hypothetical protein
MKIPLTRFAATPEVRSRSYAHVLFKIGCRSVTHSILYCFHLPPTMKSFFSTSLLLTALLLVLSVALGQVVDPGTAPPAELSSHMSPPDELNVVSPPTSMLLCYYTS